MQTLNLRSYLHLAAILVLLLNSGEKMYIMVKRKLKDYEAWKKIVTDLNQVRGEYGSKGGMVYRSASAADEVFLIFQWDDKKPYQNYFNRPDVQKALADTGTTEIIEISEAFQLME